MLLPIPLLEELLGEGITISLTFRIKPAARIAVPVPGAAYAATVLQAPHRKTELPQPVELVKSGNPGANYDRIKVVNYLSFGSRRLFLSVSHYRPSFCISDFS